MKNKYLLYALEEADGYMDAHMVYPKGKILLDYIVIMGEFVRKIAWNFGVKPTLVADMIMTGAKLAEERGLEEPDNEIEPARLN
ncbi:MAG: hypothetical protein ABSH41_14255 [Syntrophobacteraceae bacterium]|jgi:hypothetical protein